MVDLEGRTPLDLATDSAVRRMVRTEEVVRLSGQNFDLLGAVEVNDTTVSPIAKYRRIYVPSATFFILSPCITEERLP